MMCLKDLLLYTLLLPVPAASPIFIGLYFIALLVTIRPCGYCIALFSTLFLTSSPSSPFVDLPHRRLPINDSAPLTSPLEERDWLSLNLGRWADPGLQGYRMIGRLVNSGSQSSEADKEQSIVRMNTGLGGQEPVASQLDQTADSVPEEEPGWENFIDKDLPEARQEQLRRAYKTLYPDFRWPWQWFSHRFGRSAEITEPSDQSQDAGPSDDSTDPASSTIVYTTTVNATPYAVSATYAGTANPPSPIASSSSTHANAPPPGATSLPPKVPPYVHDIDTAILPPGYIDLRWRGIGFVLDLGWKRTEEGMAWEIAEAMRGTRDRQARRQVGGAQLRSGDVEVGQGDGSGQGEQQGGSIPLVSDW